ncbi:MAG TPA: XdhC family protein [Anaerolineae bacterium]|nr:XdhC family protein [Anaerolineae bacterium]
MQNDVLNRAAELADNSVAYALATVVRAEKPTSAKPGANAIITTDGTLTGWVGGSCSQPTVIRQALKALQDGEPRLLRLCPPERMGQLPQAGVIETVMRCANGGTLEVYIEPHVPRPQLVVMGHLPIAEALATLGSALGYEVVVMGWDVTPDRFPTADRGCVHLDFAQIRSARHGNVPHTFIVVASHGNYDEAALAGALKTTAPYIALVASKKRSAAIMEYLGEAGLPEEQLVRLKYPAGLDIGAVTPDEIAVSIFAEIVQLRRQHQLSSVDSPSPAEIAEAIDPVCGMTVNIATARYVTDYAGQSYYFCNASCQRSFEKEPDRYLVKEQAHAS